ncbi:hypothetical protein OBV_16610 [Oscillibacter valericigenes Sjm18-20]|nr:hypothetical protein OBV_16610 [Oscillibacter valericigenes Sjm18-20]
MNTSLVSQANGGCVMEHNRAYANITWAYRPDIFKTGTGQPVPRCNANTAA